MDEEVATDFTDRHGLKGTKAIRNIGGFSDPPALIRANPWQKPA
jgi:hypothetical protein